MTNERRNKIDDYLMDRLQGLDLEAFLKEIANDRELANEIEIQKALHEQLQTLGNLQMKERVLKIKTQIDAEKKQKNKTKTIIGILLLIVLLSGVLYFINASKNTSPSQLYAKYYEPMDLSFTNRGNDAEITLQQAGQYFNKGQFKEALPLFKTLQKESSQDSRIILAIGLSHLELELPDQALLAFQKIINNPKLPFQDQALWYAALISLKQNKITLCKEYLSKINKQTHPAYAKKANQLLLELK